MAATTLGLASQWLTIVQFPLMQPRIKDLLGIPGEMEIYDMMVVGYGASKARPKLLRAREKMVHHDYCGAENFRTGEEVRDFVRRTRAWTLATIHRKVKETEQG